MSATQTAASPATQDFSCKIYPTEWASPQPNYCLGISGIITTGYTFSAVGKVLDANSNSLGSFSIPDSTGFTFIGASPLTWGSTAQFPITISGTITVNCATLNTCTTVAHALGSKQNEGIPVCYQVSVFSNDAGNDNDWNDFVLNFQLYDSSTD